MLSGLLPSNSVQVQRAHDYILERGWRSVAILGLAFKAGTDDLRESPYVTLAESLIGRGVAVSVFDPNVTPSRLTGANRNYVFSRLPHFAELLTEDAAAAVERAEAVVLGSQPRSVLDDLDLEEKPLVALSRQSSAWD
jgi:GDP-mannose 6-dehydrogenase